MAARTAIVVHTTEKPGTGHPRVGAKFTIRSNVPTYTADDVHEKIGRTFVDTDATGAFSVTLEINDDLDPAGTWYIVRDEEFRHDVTIQLNASHAGQTVRLRDVRIDSPVNPDPMVAGAPLPGIGVPAGYVLTAIGGGGADYEPPAGGSGSIETVNGDAGPDVVLNAADVGAQPADTDLAAIAALDSSQSGVIASDGAGWLRKTYAAVKTALGLTKGDVGLGNVDNTSDANKPVSSAQQAALDLKAALASPAITGAPTAPTAPPGTNSAQLATTAYADAAAAAAAVGLLDYRGTFSASGNAFPAAGGSGAAGALLKGDFWIVSTPGTLGGTAVSNGDLVIALTDTPGSTAANWDLVEHDVGYAPENVANKSIDGTLAAASDTLYPSQKAVKTYADTKTPSSRAIAAGTGLTGGGDLTADRTLAVDTGTTSGKIPVLGTGGVLAIGRLATGAPDGTKFVRDDGTLASPPGGATSITTVATSGSSQTLTLGSSGQTTFDVTLTAACALTFAGATSGKDCTLTLIARQDATGGRTITWPGSVTWVGGVAPTLSAAAGAADIITFLTVNGGTTWYGFAGGGSSASGWKMRSTGWVTPAGQRTTAALSANALHATPIDPGVGTLTQLAIQVTTLGAGSTARVGIYSDNNGVPGTLLVEPTASTQLDCSTTGVKTTGTFSQIVTGRVWLAIVVQGAGCTVTAQAGQWTPGVGYDTAANALGFVPTGYTATGTQSGALPSTFPVNNATTTSATIAAKAA